MAKDFIFLHGGGQGSWVWDETIAAIKAQDRGEGHRVLALDVPGCGTKRDRATAAITVPDIVADLLADIDRAGMEQPILAGHSQAGTLLPRLAAARPGGFAHIVYVSCLMPTGAQTALSWRAEMPDSGSALSTGHAPGSRERYREMFCNDMDAAKAEAFLDTLGSDQWPPSSYSLTGWDYAHLADVPSTYVLCLRDAALPPAWQKMFAERAMARETIAIDAGHQVMNTRPHALAEIVLNLAS